ncbi:hypothetical protein EVAR_78824_1 [Eumeta japonica]|uniref:Uncharacterized protein n=1 Tax=Eumeta variegata TaxID=151549 RepID=A0A4C1T1R8_EUMVA|nr:hypothetical protein EVAR_78824_1 [Eumeta japonica]
MLRCCEIISCVFPMPERLPHVGSLHVEDQSGSWGERPNASRCVAACAAELDSDRWSLEQTRPRTGVSPFVPESPAKSLIQDFASPRQLLRKRLL